MNDIMKELEKIERMTEGFRARHNPAANKKTLTMNPGVSLTYRRYSAGKNLDGEEVDFCVADHVNTAGYVLSWRETQKVKDMGWGETRIGLPRRRQFTATKSHAVACKIAAQRATKCRARCEAKMVAKAAKLHAKGRDA